MSKEEVARRFCIPADAPHLEEALTHPSHANEQRTPTHYQRLEFLGDAVLELCASEALYRAFPDADEGELTRRRAQLVNAEALAQYAREAGVPEALLLGRGADATGLRTGTNVLADAVEALIAAAYLDAGMDAAREACKRIVGFGSRAPSSDQDAKTRLQELVQAKRLPAPQYEVVETWGAAHERWFRARVSVGDEELAVGIGRSKRAAERAAALTALDEGAAHALGAANAPNPEEQESE